MKQLLLFILLFCSIHAYSQSANDFVKKGMDAMAALNEKQALEHFKKAIDLDKDNDAAYAGASLMYSRIGNRQSSKETQKKYFVAAKVHALRALKLKSASSFNNYVMAVAMGRMALISGSKEKVAASRDIKKHADLAIKYEPSNEQAWNVLGKWNYAVSNLNFAEKAAANVLFGGLPDGDIQRAIKCFEKSKSLNKGYILNYLDLAKCYIQIGKKDAAKRLLEDGLKLANTMEDDTAHKAEMRKLLAGL